MIKDHQGQKFGLRLVEMLNHIAKEVGCYKVSNTQDTAQLIALTDTQAILDCSAKNIGFYEKSGYETAGHEMCCFFDEEAKQRGV